ncbi:endoglucanase-4 [Aspergillus bombycis]|uniref:AA9 family lytic polysaccharide monooxygenase n=1 Tax=Aspergillus bombycis TaxID=109264 RepID=A0A1F8AAJ7_9EURO|nr:endoglucanase-4 [Aspergillus bombycis]OGM48742.1 endoglucanase-4 [Aspergillus bombycis]
MRHVQSASLLTALLSATKVAAHGHVTNIVVNGVYYEGFDINSFPYMGESAPTVAAWTTPNTGNGPLAPDDYTSPDIICHQNATAGNGYVEVNAGDRISLQWTPWPESHHGPVIDYLARCEPNCASVDKTSLEFFKIDGVGIVDGSSVPGVWGDDQLIKNNNSWLVEIPKSIAPGYYVLRHELIALHSAGTEGGAQNYPSCFNLKVNGDGADKPAGVLPSSWPSLYTGAATGVTQATSAVTSTGTALTVGAAATTPASGSGASSSGAASSSAAPTRSPSSSAVPSSSAAPTSSAAASR